MQSLSQTKPSWAQPKYLIGALFCLALAVRLFYLYEIKDNPFFNVPQIDALFHDEWARQLLAGDWSSSAQGVFYKAPLYPYFMALVYKIFGHSYLVLRLIQLLMGSVSCWLIYLLGRTYFNQRVGILAFLLAALYGTFIYFEGEMEIVSLHIFLNLLLLLALTKADQEGKNHYWLLSGLLLGLSALTVPTILLFLPFILLWLGINQGKAKRSILRPAILLLLSTMLTIAPATLHNYLHERGFVLVSANAGLNFYLGNNLHADKTTAIRPGIVWDHFTAQPHVAAGHEVSRIEENRYWRDKSLKYITNNPGHFIKLLGKRTGLFWQAYEIKRNRDIYFFKRYSRLLQGPLFGFGLIAPLALLGIGLTWFERCKYYLLLSYALVVMLGVILFFVTARYRLPMVPILILFAACSLDWLRERIGRRDYPRLAYPLIASLVLAGVINYDFWDLKSTSFARPHHNLGFVYYKQEDYAKAVEEWNAALKLYAPGDLEAVDTHFYLAQLYNYQLKDYPEAINHCQQGLKILPDMAELESEMGWAYYQQGSVEKAIESLKKVQQSDPLYEPAYQKLALIYSQRGDWKKARQVHQQAASLIKDYDNKPALTQEANFYFKQGLAKAEQKEWQEAEKLFQQALKNNPNNDSAHYNLGLVYLYTKRWKQAAKALQQAAKLNPQKANNFGALGSAYLNMGEKDKASRAFERALEINPGLELARRELERLEP